MYHKKRIGIFISHMFGSFQTQLCQGIINTFMEFGYNTDIFTSLDGENLDCYACGENSILKIPKFEDFSGIIFASATYLDQSLKNEILHTLQKKCSCPVIEVNQQNALYPAVFLDNHSAMEELVVHLITQHHLKHLCYLGNSKEQQFSQKRQDIFLKTLQRYRLLASSHTLYECDYTVEEIQSALDFFLSGDLFPQAILCYNDRMALAVMQLLLERGIRVPEDIAVTGFDNLEEGEHIIPALTTVGFPIYELGCLTAKQLLFALEQTVIPSATTLTARPLIKNSCGCLDFKSESLLSFQQKQQHRIQELESAILYDLNMSSSFTGITDIDQGMELLQNFVSRLKCHEMYLCLYPDWDAAPDQILSMTDRPDPADIPQNAMLLKFAVRDGKRLPECTFQPKHILPNYITQQASYTYLYTPLFFGKHAFGYLAFSFADNQIHYPFSYVSWIMNINSMLNNVCNTLHMGLLTQRLQFLSHFDELTGHYNRLYFFQTAPQFLIDALAQYGCITAYRFHLESLSAINDTHSVLEGDFALQILGHALRQAMNESGLCGRAGDGEFYLLRADRDEADAKKLIQKVRDYLSNYNKLHPKPYLLTANCGFAQFQGTACSSAKQLLQELWSKATFETGHSSDTG